MNRFILISYKICLAQTWNFHAHKTECIKITLRPHKCAFLACGKYMQKPFFPFKSFFQWNNTSETAQPTEFVTRVRRMDVSLCIHLCMQKISFIYLLPLWLSKTNPCTRRLDLYESKTNLCESKLNCTLALSDRCTSVEASEIWLVVE